MTTAALVVWSAAEVAHRPPEHHADVLVLSDEDFPQDGSQDGALDLPGFLVERHQAATQFVDHVVGAGCCYSCGCKFSVADRHIAFDAIQFVLTGGNGWPNGLAGGIASFHQGDQSVEPSAHQLALLAERLFPLTGWHLQGALLA